jgi:hypothetical protein
MAYGLLRRCLQINQRPRRRVLYVGSNERDVTLELPAFLIFNLDRIWIMPNRRALDSRQEKT